MKSVMASDAVCGQVVQRAVGRRVLLTVFAAVAGYISAGHPPLTT